MARRSRRRGASGCNSGQVVIPQHEHEVEQRVLIEGRLNLREEIGAVTPTVRMQDKQLLDLIKYHHPTGLVGYRQAAQGVKQAAGGGRPGTPAARQFSATLKT